MNLYVALSKADLSMSILRQGNPEVIYRPGYRAAKRSQSAAAGSKTTWRRVGEGIILLSEKCSNCGRTAKEIERKCKGLEL